MWIRLLQLGDFIKNETEKGISITSKDRTKRYYYQEGKQEHILIMFNPSTANGIKNPRAYTTTSMLPANAVDAPDAIISTEDKAGPIQGVQAKLNVNPSTIATNGPIFLF